MTCLPRHVLAPLAVVCLSFAIVSCAASKSQSFKMSFLPATPSAELEPIAEPPAADHPMYRSEMPILPALALPPRPSEADLRIRRAEEQFESGKRAYQDGNSDEARKSFNRAVDILLGTPENAADRQKMERRLDEMVNSIYRYDLDGLGSGEASDKVAYDKSPLDSIIEMTFPIDPQLRPKVKEEIQATLSQLPLEESDAVVSYIHFFSTEKGKRILTAGLRRAGRYKPLIQRVLSEEGVPAELIFLAQAESGFLPRAVSNKAAAGMWQFVQFRGREYGLNQTPYSDDRLDPEKATRAAARHLKDLFNHFGDWYLAMAAYNCGPGCVDRAVQRTGYADFWSLRDLRVLPRETTNYVPLILAMTIMAKNPKDYGLEDVELDKALEYDKLTVTAHTNLALIADAADRPISDIRELNPALLKSLAPAGYEVRLPKGSLNTVSAALDTVPAANRAAWRLHHVEQGETLASIAQHYGASASSIAGANHNFVAAPNAGDLLLIPASYQEPRTAMAKRAVTRVATTRTAALKQTHATSSRYAANRVSSRTANAFKATPVARKATVSRRVPPKVLHRRASLPGVATANASMR